MVSVGSLRKIEVMVAATIGCVKTNFAIVECESIDVKILHQET